MLEKNEKNGTFSLIFLKIFFVQKTKNMTNNVVNLKFDFFLIYFTILYGNTHTVCKKLYYKRDISVFIKIGSHIGRHLGF